MRVRVLNHYTSKSETRIGGNLYYIYNVCTGHVGSVYFIFIFVQGIYFPVGFGPDQITLHLLKIIFKSLGFVILSLVSLEVVTTRWSTSNYNLKPAHCAQ